eukprot:CAMPEP_0198254708 /NCGR_PEP_ID=MMETSP1447-20131203/4986_1 /TAXON_ID=420782 /ORGANISM="Chaetoceros dichaeta, Strain CCMP1751" /LENGTH=188 /DNA_ID=CAMNT_0043940873 /DNA_START=203 /DNA_END=769 /DNA_ORIENTATION=+
MATSLVTLRRMEQVDRIAVLGLQVTPDQLPFVDHPVDIILNEKGVDFHVITTTTQDDDDDAIIVGFFLTDEDVGRTYDFISSDDTTTTSATTTTSSSIDLGLRKFLIDQKHQGQGFGGAAACQLQTYVHDSYPQYDNLLLTVNCRNTAAAHVYRTAGFQCDGEDDLYLGGAVGPQYIMRLPLQSEEHL